MRIVRFVDVPHTEWDAWVHACPTSQYQHAAVYLAYLAKRRGVIHDETFAVLSDDDAPVALVPVPIAQDQHGLRIDYAGTPAGSPCIHAPTARMRRKALDEVREAMRTLAKRHDAHTWISVQHPLTRRAMSGDARPIDAMALQRLGVRPDPTNTLIQDLTGTTDDVHAQVSKAHRKHIRRAAREGVAVTVLGEDAERAATTKAFALFQEAHEDAAGGATRPQETWTLMADAVTNGHAFLAIASKDEDPLGFLLVGRFDKMAFGWSQANRPDGDAIGSLRHALEWHAMMYAKELGADFYDLGERPYAASWARHHTAKERSIGDFKERYGADLWPLTHWYGAFTPSAARAQWQPALTRHLETPTLACSPPPDGDQT